MNHVVNSMYVSRTTAARGYPYFSPNTKIWKLNEHVFKDIPESCQNCPSKDKGPCACVLPSTNKPTNTY